MAPTLVIVGTGRMAGIRARAARLAAPDLAVQIAGRDPGRVAALAAEVGARPWTWATCEARTSSAR